MTPRRRCAWLDGSGGAEGWQRCEADAVAGSSYCAGHKARSVRVKSAEPENVKAPRRRGLYNHTGAGLNVGRRFSK